MLIPRPERFTGRDRPVKVTVTFRFAGPSGRAQWHLFRAFPAVEPGEDDIGLLARVVEVLRWPWSVRCQSCSLGTFGMRLAPAMACRVDSAVREPVFEGWHLLLLERTILRDRLCV